MGWATPHPTLCNLEALPSLSEPRPHRAPADYSVAGPTAYPPQAWERGGSGTFSGLVSQSRTPVCQMLACYLAAPTQAGRVPKAPHPRLGHEPLGSHPLPWGLHVPPASNAPHPWCGGFNDPTARPVAQQVGPGPLVDMV